MTRRDAYLLDWGFIHSALGGMAFFSSEYKWVYIVAFIGSGSLAIISAVVPWPFLQVSAFTFLTIAASLRALYHIVQLAQGDDMIVNSFGLLLWLGVCVGQIIVSGWRLSAEDLGAAVHEGN